MRASHREGDIKFKRRRRSRKRTRLYAIAVVGLVLTVAAGMILFASTRPTHLTVAVGPADGKDAQLLQQAARVLAQRSASIQLDIRPRRDSQEAKAALALGTVDLAAVRADQMPDTARVAVIIRRSPMVIWTTVKANASLKDALRPGTKVGLLSDEPGDAELLKRVLAIEGVAVDQAELIRKADLPVLLADTAVQVFAAIGPTDDQWVSDALNATLRARGQLSILEISAAEAVVRKYPKLESVTLPKGAFGPAWPTDQIDNVDTIDVLAARRSLSDVDAANLARELFAHREAILSASGSSASLLAPDTAKDTALAVHPGVAAFIDGIERTFLERYSDYFWGLVLILSGIGSLGATFRAYFYRDEQQYLADARQEVIAFAKAIREGAAGAEIEKFDQKVHKLVQQTLDRYEQGVIDEGGLAAFGLALDHYQGARATALNPSTYSITVKRPQPVHDEVSVRGRPGDQK